MHKIIIIGRGYKRQCGNVGMNYNGQYFDKKKPVMPSRQALNDTDALKLWEISEKLTDIKFLDPAQFI
jgi:hypothetical protein